MLPWPPLEDHENQLSRSDMPLVETYSDLSAVFEHTSIFNPWKTEDSMNYYNLEEKIRTGEMTQAEKPDGDLKFGIMRCNFNMDNVRLIERLPSTGDYNWFFVLHYQPGFVFVINRSYIEQTGSIINCSSGANISVLNSSLYS